MHQINAWDYSWHQIEQIVKARKPVEILAYDGQPLYSYPERLTPEHKKKHEVTLRFILQLGFSLPDHVLEGHEHLAQEAITERRAHSG